MKGFAVRTPAGEPSGEIGGTSASKRVGPIEREPERMCGLSLATSGDKGLLICDSLFLGVDGSELPPSSVWIWCRYECPKHMSCVETHMVQILASDAQRSDLRLE